MADAIEKPINNRAVNYDTFCVPLFIQPFMGEVSALASDCQGDVLETACGTGVATAAIVAGGHGIRSIAATDFDDSMVSRAQAKAWPAHVSFSTADAQALPFPESSFDAAFCAFGVMFFPDVQRALLSARRVLRSGSALHLVTWGDFEENDAFILGDEVRASLFPKERQHFGRDVLCRFSDADTLKDELEKAGFWEVSVRPVRKQQPLGPHDLAHNLLASRGHVTSQDVQQARDVYQQLLKGRTEFTLLANVMTARA